MDIYLGANFSAGLKPAANNEKPPQRLVFSRLSGFSLLGGSFNCAPKLVCTRQRSKEVYAFLGERRCGFHTAPALHKLLCLQVAQTFSRSVVQRAKPWRLLCLHAARTPHLLALIRRC